MNIIFEYSGREFEETLVRVILLCFCEKRIRESRNFEEILIVKFSLQLSSISFRYFRSKIFEKVKNQNTKISNVNTADKLRHPTIH